MRILATITVFAALAAASQIALAQQPGGNDKAFCLQGAQTSQANVQECRFDTMAQCEAAAKGQSTAKCGPNPKMAGPPKK
jgi:hypothetical protein